MLKPTPPDPSGHHQDSAIARFEPGLAGKAVKDCRLLDFGCAKGPLPITACAGGDGYDDTLGGILEAGLVGRTKWKVE